jgi:hypothetical protein
VSLKEENNINMMGVNRVVKVIRRWGEGLSPRSPSSGLTISKSWEIFLAACLAQEQTIGPLFPSGFSEIMLFLYNDGDRL